MRTELGTQTQSKKHADLIRKAEFDPWTALPTVVLRVVLRKVLIKSNRY